MTMPPESADHALVAGSVSFVYEEPSGRRVALDGVSAVFAPGRVHFVCGPSGSGKSTLAMVLAGLAMPTSGQATLGAAPTSECGSEIAFVFQFPEALFLEDSVYQEIVSATPSGSMDEAVGLMREIEFDLPHFRETHPLHLSASAGRMIAMVVQMIRNPRVLILDEPTIGLDWVFHRKVVRLLSRWISAERILIIVTHDLRLLSEFDGAVTILKEGSVAWRGSTHEILADQTRLRALGLTS